MLFSYTAFDEHVVHIDFHVPPYLIGKDFVDHLLKSGPSILQAKWHDLIAVQSYIGSKGCFLLIVRIHLNLVVP